MDSNLPVSSPPEVPARSSLRNSIMYQNTKVRDLSRPQREDNAHMDERHYAALSKKIDDVLEIVGSDWPLTVEYDAPFGHEPHHDYQDESSSSVYSESLISDDEDHSPTSITEPYSRVPSLDAAHGRDTLSPTGSWSSDTSGLQQEEFWTPATERLRIRRDSMADYYEDHGPLPIVTTQQMLDLIEHLPQRRNTYSIDVDNANDEYGVPFSYSKGPSTRTQKGDPSQFIWAGSESHMRRSSSLLTRKSSIKSVAKRLLTL